MTSWNCTVITLVPKVPHATRVKEFRSILCFTVVYKIVAKILAVRLQRVIPGIVS